MNIEDIGSMTLVQAKEYCREFRHKNGYPFEEKGCELKRRHICLDWVHEWDFDRITPEELEICRVLGADLIKRIGESAFVNLYRKTNSDGVSQLVSQVICGMFPSVKPGDCIQLDGLL